MCVYIYIYIYVAGRTQHGSQRAAEVCISGNHLSNMYHYDDTYRISAANKHFITKHIMFCLGLLCYAVL